MSPEIATTNIEVEQEYQDWDSENSAFENQLYLDSPLPLLSFPKMNEGVRSDVTHSVTWPTFNTETEDTEPDYEATIYNTGDTIHNTKETTKPRSSFQSILVTSVSTIILSAILLKMCLNKVAKASKGTGDIKKDEYENVAPLESEAKKLESTAIGLAKAIKEFVSIAETKVEGGCAHGGACEALATLKKMYRLLEDPKRLLEWVKSESETATEDISPDEVEQEDQHRVSGNPPVVNQLHADRPLPYPSFLKSFKAMGIPEGPKRHRKLTAQKQRCQPKEVKKNLFEKNLFLSYAQLQRAISAHENQLREFTKAVDPVLRNGSIAEKKVKSTEYQSFYPETATEDISPDEVEQEDQHRVSGNSPVVNQLYADRPLPYPSFLKSDKAMAIPDGPMKNGKHTAQEKRCQPKEVEKNLFESYAQLQRNILAHTNQLRELEKAAYRVLRNCTIAEKKAKSTEYQSFIPETAPKDISPDELEQEDQHRMFGNSPVVNQLHADRPLPYSSFLKGDKATAIPECLKKYGKHIAQEKRCQPKEVEKNLFESYPKLQRDIPAHTNQQSALAKADDWVPRNRTIAENKVKSTEYQSFVPESIIEEIINSLLKSVNKRYLHLLLSSDEEWEQFVADAGLTRDEAKAVREGLKKRGELTAMEVKEMHQEEKEFREKFLKLYPQVKKDVEEHIKQLRALAEKADEVHKNCTIAKVVAESTGIVSGILCIAGIELAPFTGGLSLALTGTGSVMRSAANATTLVSSIVERSYMLFIEIKAQNLESTRNNLRLLWKVLDDSREIISSLVNSFRVVRKIAKQVRAIRLTKLSSKAGAQSSNLFGEGFEGAARTMNKEIRIIGGVFRGLAILVDLVQDSKDLLEGGKSQSGVMLRQRAQELENMLMGLQQFYEKLQ